MPVGLAAAQQSTARVGPSAVGTIGSSLGLVTGIGGAVTSLIGFAAAFNKPYGTCAPSAKTSQAFLTCWKYDKPEKFIPYFKGNPTAKQPGTKGWDFAFCRNAVAGSTVSAEGCQAPCDCSVNNCVCAPVGAVMGLPDGTFVDAKGNNLGPAIISTNPGSYAGAGGPFGGFSLGNIGTAVGGGAVVTNRSIAASGLQNQSVLSSLGLADGLSSPIGKYFVIGLVGALVIAGAVAAFGGKK